MDYTKLICEELVEKIKKTENPPNFINLEWRAGYENCKEEIIKLIKTYGGKLL